MGWGKRRRKEGGREGKGVLAPLLVFNRWTECTSTFPLCAFDPVEQFVQRVNLCQNNATNAVGKTCTMRPFIRSVRFTFVVLTGLCIVELWHNGWAVVGWSQQALVGGDLYCFRQKMTANACFCK